MLGLPLEWAYTFYDVAEDRYYHGYIMSARAAGLAAGVDDYNFAPGNNLTRQEMFVLAYRAFRLLDTGLEAVSGGVLNEFEDRGEIADWAVIATALLVGNGLIHGADGHLFPTAYATRAETAVFIYRVLGILAI